jgi:Protein of unknown function (DUF1553)/Protein of unknown function (DUF1549)
MFLIGTHACGLWSCLAIAQSPGPKFEVFPPHPTVSADYPARLVVVETSLEGAVIDRTQQSSILLPEDSGLVVNPATGEISVSPEAALGQPALCEATIQVGDQQIRKKISIIDTQPRLPTFAREVAAVLGKSGCNLGTCHGNLHGKGGLRLSLRGDDPELDFATIVRGNAGRRVDLFSAHDSLILKKPTGLTAHQGGVRFHEDSREYRLLQAWIKYGCRWNEQHEQPTSEPAESESLVQLNVYPNQLLLSPQAREQALVVIGEFADGARRDVTTWARYEPSLPTGVSVDHDGLVRSERPMDVSISISYLSGRAAARLTFLAEEQSAWTESPAPMKLDQLVDNQLQRMRLQPAELATENVILRRLYLVVAGRLPTPAEAQRYLAATETDKRERLIEQLLNDTGYASLWALRWSDLLRNEQKVMSRSGAQGWHAWMADQVRSDRPLTGFVSDMIRTLGSTYENPPASFHRTHRDPETAAESIGQVFLGVRLQCARCHNHPFDKWRQDDYYGLAAYFTTLERKQLDNQPKDKFDKHIISGDEQVSLMVKPAQIWHPGRSTAVPPKPLTATYRDSDSNPPTGSASSSSPLESLAEWLTTDNRMFARNMANRVFYHFMGRGIVDPPDDFRDSNPPSNPELLEYLTDELMRSDYSVRHLSRLILQSRTFARAAMDDRYESGIDGAPMFAGYPLRRMPAEVLLDALSDVTQVITKLDEGDRVSTSSQRAVARAEVPVGANFLTTFGKPNRLLVCECERSSSVSLGQSLVLVNGSEMREKLAESRNQLTELLQRSNDQHQMLEQLYMSTLTRMPEPSESVVMLEYLANSGDKRAALEDILWALINSQEFALIR